MCAVVVNQHAYAKRTVSEIASSSSSAILAVYPTPLCIIEYFILALQPPRPDGKEETLGLKRLDEPAHQQSDPTVLTLQLRALSKKSVLEPMTVSLL